MYIASTLLLTALAGLSSASTGIVHFTNSSSTVGPTGGSVPSRGSLNPHPTAAPPAKWNSTTPTKPSNGTIIIVGPGQVTSTIYTTTTVCPTTTWFQGKPTAITTTSTIVETRCPKCEAKPTTGANPAPGSGSAPGAAPGSPASPSSPAASRPAAPGAPQPAANCPVCPACPNGGAAIAAPATVTVTVTAPAAGAPTTGPAGAGSNGSGSGSNVPPPPPGNNKPSGLWIYRNGSHPQPTGSGRPLGSGHALRPTGAGRSARPSAGTSSFLTLSTAAH